MRYTDLKIVENKKQKVVEYVANPALANPAQMNMDQALEFIDVQSDHLEPNVQDIIARGLATLKNYLTNKLKQLDPDAAIPTNESLEQVIDKEIDDIQQLREMIKQAGGDPDDPKIVEYTRNMLKFALPRGAQLGHETLNNIKAEIEALYTPLASKIESGGEGFAPEVPKPDNKEDEAAYKAALAYYEEMMVKRSELSKTGVAIRDTIADMVNAVMEKAQREEAIQDAEAELERIRDFLKRCVEDPFIDFDSLIAQTHGTVEQEFAKKGKDFIDIFNNFENILGRTIDKSGAGAWGPGELGLLMLSDPVKKGSKGDIETASGKQVEVKASKTAASGARLNVEQATKGNLVKDYNLVLKKYFGDRIAVGDTIMTVEHETPKGQVNFTIKGFTILNSWVEELIKQNKWKRMNAVSFLIDSVNIPMKNYVGNKAYDKALKDSMKRVVTKEGLFSFQAFQKEYTKLLFGVYKSEMLDCILVINPKLGTFLVMNDPKEVDATVNRGLVISGGIDFKDKQSTKSPQIGVGKVVDA